MKGMYWPIHQESLENLEPRVLWMCLISDLNVYELVKLEDCLTLCYYEMITLDLDRCVDFPIRFASDLETTFSFAPGHEGTPSVRLPFGFLKPGLLFNHLCQRGSSIFRVSIVRPLFSTFVQRCRKNLDVNGRI